MAVTDTFLFLWLEELGKAARVEPLKAMLKPHETNRLTLECDELQLSSSTIYVNLSL
jgi:hypothetical protein